MPAVLGNLIVIAILLVVIYFCGRNAIRDIRAELSGKGCSGCGGGCSSCCGCHKECSSRRPDNPANDFLDAGDSGQ